MDNSINRRNFIAASGAAMASTAIARAEDLDPRVAAELKNRMKFLSPPDGIASDLDVRPSPNVAPFEQSLFVPPVARPLINLTSPAPWQVTEDAFGQPMAAYAIHWDPHQFAGPKTPAQKSFFKNWMNRLVRENLIGRDDLQHLHANDQAWLIVFYLEFQKLSESLSKSGVDIGGFPIPSGHQRFFDFKPLKFYAMWEMEFEWKFADHAAAEVKPECDLEDACLDRRHRKGLKKADWPKKTWTWGFAQLHREGDPVNDRAQYLTIGDAKFEAMSPGPTYKAKYGEPILVRRINQLPEILDDDHTWTAGGHPIRRNIKFALPSTTTHLHNAHTASESDGHPNDWINPGEYWDHHYGNFPSGYDNREKLSTLWYHDHRMDFTASNVYAGLDGFYFLFDEEARLESDLGTPAKANQERSIARQAADLNDEQLGWRLPAKEYDIPLIFHDLLFDEDSDGTAQLVFDGFNTDGILGDRYTVNRVIQPSFEVERRKYRFRLLNGGPSRFYEFFLHTGQPEEFYASRENGGPYVPSIANPEDEPASFIVIAGDGNFQPNPLFAKSIFMGVAQRNDVIIDFSDEKFKDCDHVYLVNRLQQTNGRGPNNRFNEPEQAKDKASAEAHVKQFLNEYSVVRFDLKPADNDPSRFPLKFRDFPPVDLTEVKRERIWDFDYDGGLWTINGLTYEPNRIDAGIEQDSAEIWTFRNTGNSWSHPIHSHFTEFIILEINGVPQYQSTVQSSNIPRRSMKGGFVDHRLDRKELNAAYEHRIARVQAQTNQPTTRTSAVQKYLSDLKSDSQLALASRKPELIRDRISSANIEMAMAVPENNPLQAQIDRFHEAIRKCHNDPSSNNDLCGDYYFFAELLNFLLKYYQDYPLISSDLQTLIGDPGDSTPSKVIADALFENRLKFANAVKLLADSRFWNLIFREDENDEADYHLAVLDLNDTPDSVKGIGRFMGGPRRDVAIILPNWEVKVFMRWKDFLGKHVMHCHNVVHEDHAMMIRWDIVPPGHGFDTPKYTSEVYGADEGIPHAQPAPGHTQSHPHDSDSPSRR